LFLYAAFNNHAFQIINLYKRLTMKRIIFLLFLLVPFVYVNAQIKVDVKGKITREADRRANKRTDKAINKAFDKVDEEIDSAIKKDDKEKKSRE